MNLSRNYFLKDWISYNLLGWLLGVIIGPILFSFTISPALFRNANYDLQTNLAPIFFSFPVGVGLGIMQSIKLRCWEVPSSLWILATSLGFGIPATLISWFLNYPSWFLSYVSSPLGYRAPLFLSIAEIIIIGLIVGGLQAILLRRSVLKTRYWVLAYIFGLISLGVVTIGIFFGTLYVAEPTQKFFYSLRLWQLGQLVVTYRGELINLFTLLSVPFFAALFIGLPTGIILQKFGNMQIANEGKDEVPSKEYLAK